MKITADTGIMEIVRKHPEIITVFQGYGLGCIGCVAAQYETIGQGAAAHGIDIDNLLEDLNSVLG